MGAVLNLTWRLANITNQVKHYIIQMPRPTTLKECVDQIHHWTNQAIKVQFNPNFF